MGEPAHRRAEQGLNLYVILAAFIAGVRPSLAHSCCSSSSVDRAAARAAPTGCAVAPAWHLVHAQLSPGGYFAQLLCVGCGWLC